MNTENKIMKRADLCLREPDESTGLENFFQIAVFILIKGSIDGCLFVELPALVLVIIYQARLNAI